MSLGLGGLGAVGALTNFAHGASLGGKVELVPVDIPVRNLPREFAGYKILFLSDLHLATCVPEDSIVNALDMARQCEPDLVLLGGDYIWVPDHTYSSLLLSMRNFERCAVGGLEEASLLYSRLADYLKSVRVRDGVVGVMGNHDNWFGREHCLRELSAAGVRFLVNAYATIRRNSSHLVIYGSDDYLTGVPRNPQLGLRDDGSNVRILVAHNPDYWSHLLRRTKQPLGVDLALAGHTHGGQIKLPGLGALYTGIRDKRFSEGLVILSDTHFYTTRGIGVVGVPLRVNCPPEATLLTLLMA